MEGNKVWDGCLFYAMGRPRLCPHGSCPMFRATLHSRGHDPSLWGGRISGINETLSCLGPMPSTQEVSIGPERGSRDRVLACPACTGPWVQSSLLQEGKKRRGSSSSYYLFMLSITDLIFLCTSLFSDGTKNAQCENAVLESPGIVSFTLASGFS